MRVKVSYGMEYEEVPELIQELLTSCQKELVALSNKNLNTFNTEELIESIDKFRQRLEWVDSRLEDSSSILIGYNHTQKETNIVEELECPSLPELEDDA